MSRRRKLLIAVGVAAVSVIAAAPFLRPGGDGDFAGLSGSESAGSESADAALKLDDANGGSPGSAVGMNVTLPAEPPVADRALERIPAAGTGDPEKLATQAAQAESAPPPLLPSEFPRPLAAADSLSTSTSQENDSFAASAAAPAGMSPVAATRSGLGPLGTPLPEAASETAAPAETAEVRDPELSRPLRRHVIRDGDSLESLAERYLGSADRAGEIFDANRGVLTRRDLLPIGVEIAIPPAAR